MYIVVTWIEDCGMDSRVVDKDDPIPALEEAMFVRLNAARKTPDLTFTRDHIFWMMHSDEAADNGFRWDCIVLELDGKPAPGPWSFPNWRGKLMAQRDKLTKAIDTMNRVLEPDVSQLTVGRAVLTAADLGALRDDYVQQLATTNKRLDEVNADINNRLILGKSAASSYDAACGKKTVKK